jgi:lipopolysaccharide biosynthesis protein
MQKLLLQKKLNQNFILVSNFTLENLIVLKNYYKSIDKYKEYELLMNLNTYSLLLINKQITQTWEWIFRVNQYQPCNLII